MNILDHQNIPNLQSSAASLWRMFSLHCKHHIGARLQSLYPQAREQGTGGSVTPVNLEAYCGSV